MSVASCNFDSAFIVFAVTCYSDHSYPSGDCAGCSETGVFTENSNIYTVVL